MAVLVALTGTDEGREAVRAAEAEARLRGEELLVFALDGSPSPDLDTDVRTRFLEPGERERDPVGSLLDAAQSQDVSVLVIGLRPRSPVGKFLLGSQAQEILLQAAVPVLAVKPASH